jgi:hypothetical protein
MLSRVLECCISGSVSIEVHAQGATVGVGLFWVFFSECSGLDDGS